MTQPTPPVGNVTEVTEALNVLRRMDRRLAKMPHAMAVWIVGCLATQYAEEPEE